MIRGALFDMDGVIVDSERVGCDVFMQLAKELGYPAQETDYYRVLGTTDERTLEILAELWGPEARGKYIQDQIHQTRIRMAMAGTMPTKKGLSECMQGLKQRGLRIALATSAPRYLVEHYLQTIPAMMNVFDAIVCGGEAGASKPAPDIYLEAARRIDVDIHDCIGVEDSLNGLKSLTAAGCVRVMIPDLLPCEGEFVPYTQHCLKDLSQLCSLVDRLNLEKRVKA